MEEKLRSGEGDSRAVAVALTGIALAAQTWFMRWAVVGLDLGLILSSWHRASLASDVSG